MWRSGGYLSDCQLRIHPLFTKIWQKNSGHWGQPLTHSKIDGCRYHWSKLQSIEIIDLTFNSWHPISWFQNLTISIQVIIFIVFHWLWNYDIDAHKATLLDAFELGEAISHGHSNTQGSSTDQEEDNRLTTQLQLHLFVFEQEDN